MGSVLRQLPRDPVYWILCAGGTQDPGGKPGETPHVCIFKALPPCSPILRVPWEEGGVGGEQAVTSMECPPALVHWLNPASPLLLFPDPHLPPHLDIPTFGLL